MNNMNNIIPNNTVNEELKECFVCCTQKSTEKIFKCSNKECNFDVCIDCSKRYLLNSIQEEHCMNCNNFIDTMSFLNQFGNKWVFGIYKKHKENVLIDIEKQRFKDDIQNMAIENKTKHLDILIKEEYQKYKNTIDKLYLEKYNLKKPTNKTKYISNYQCPSQECHGFLDNQFKCGLCSQETCKKCYVLLDKTNPDEIHECNEEQIETFKKIKEESKTCPSCGEFISKISGCDQMFCVKCGTAFSWKTGNIEKGIVHNPHAHNYFQNNPEMAEIYRNNLNGNNGGECRNPLPLLTNITKNTDIEYKQKLTSLHRTIAEYRQYYRENYLRKIDSNISNNMNKDYRYQLLNKEINEKKFKQIIHQRYKKHNFDKELAKLILSTFDITELMLWEIVNIKTDQEQKSIEKISLKIYEGIQELINETNTNIIEIKKSFGYTTSSGIKLFDNLRGFPKNFKN